MNEREIFGATNELQEATEALAQTTNMVLPQFEDALRGPDEPAEGEQPREVIALLRQRPLAEGTGKVMLALDRLRRALGTGPCFRLFFAWAEAPAAVRRQVEQLLGEPGLSSNGEDLPEAMPESLKPVAAGVPPSSINFGQFNRLEAPQVLERTIEILAPLPGAASVVPLRLEAHRVVGEASYLIEVSRSQRIMLRVPSHEAEEPDRPPQEVRAWVAFDLVPSDQPTADAALEEVLRSLEMRCA
jgi:hypothetical protein